MARKKRKRKIAESVKGDYPRPVTERDRLKGLLHDNGNVKTKDWLLAGRGKPRKAWFSNGRYQPTRD
jgi:hypothetical protein